ncbi:MULTISPECIES: motility associated factor glycosyltransferase family protein [Clostridium]|uniref:6-hydroxymethylpterin diphosphokinase MptE-like domain-containing protein n=1 Tax=Clostridium beijerinckii TaxID=1520 RepID=A0A1S9N7E5_CLOBE|nr:MULTISPECIES: 6-hydroxymethylpterin diphosphokinase MptE-like protein [Clostridium]MBN7574111.1 motility associated factor glycosyltransferase family protein [Clostridium beijerinckii]MBN7577877.1 motility associated factor glycosyltransferase family protein [Clostridium beijerinckii]MBN7583861.1 motility associated factor glycosyltransferase family protein [Clostridium beijerinckii]MBO0518860.1 motility associated factor glycosyltransferase family protein [Clostridium beijerinckii]MZK50021
MQKVKTLDGYHVFSIEKDDNNCYLADKENYKKEIENLLSSVNDIKFDSLILIFGIDTGEYLDSLNDVLCEKNKVLIFEPNKDIFNYNKEKINKDNIHLIFYDKDNIKANLYKEINSTNFNNLYVHAFGNYAEVYKYDYEIFIENLDDAYYTACSSISVANRFKDIFIKNFIANLKALKNSTPLNSYEDINKGIPAIVVSAGPSLDKNIADMVTHKKELERYFIIAGSRTLKALIKNNIKPDMIVSIDPVDDNYDMMKDYLKENSPLAFYEYSNRYLVRDYEGEKIYLSTFLSNTIQELNNLKGTFLGGSVAHTCIDIANIMGCSPIILVGQDLAFTYDKHHSESAIFESDDTKNYEASLKVENIFGEKIRTNITLNQFRLKMEEYIDFYKTHKQVEFINVSYGAEIKGAPHKELCDVFKTYTNNNVNKKCIVDKSIQVDAETVVSDVIKYLEEYIDKANNGEALCNSLLTNELDKSLVDIDENDEDFQKFLDVMDIVNDFESSKERYYLGGYYNKFLFDVKEEIFNMHAVDYESLTSNLKYQSKCFLSYFLKMKGLLEKVKSLALETFAEFYYAINQ